MFGVSPQEMMVIALFALIIFGPGKLPEVMREGGKHYRKFRGMADEMTGELNKVTAEARKELDGALGDLGPMGKDLEKSLGVGGSKRTNTTSSGNRKPNTTSSTASKTSTASKSTSTSKAKGTSTASGKKSASSSVSAGTTKNSSSNTSTATATTKTSTKPKVASKEDPFADFALFEPEARVTKRRSRTAAPSAITDLTPRDIVVEAPTTADGKVDLSALDDPLARARARRRNAGYARA